ncbi:MAG: hypothetical protein AB7V08_13790 [Elusimicrobiales bacterium]
MGAGIGFEPLAGFPLPFLPAFLPGEQVLVLRTDHLLRLGRFGGRWRGRRHGGRGTAGALGLPLALARRLQVLDTHIQGAGHRALGVRVHHLAGERRQRAVEFLVRQGVEARDLPAGGDRFGLALRRLRGVGAGLDLGLQVLVGLLLVLLVRQRGLHVLGHDRRQHAVAALGGGHAGDGLGVRAGGRVDNGSPRRGRRRHRRGRRRGRGRILLEVLAAGLGRSAGQRGTRHLDAAAHGAAQHEASADALGHALGQVLVRVDLAHAQVGAELLAALGDAFLGRLKAHGLADGLGAVLGQQCAHAGRGRGLRERPGLDALGQLHGGRVDAGAGQQRREGGAVGDALLGGLRGNALGDEGLVLRVGLPRFLRQGQSALHGLVGREATAHAGGGGGDGRFRGALASGSRGGGVVWRSSQGAAGRRLGGAARTAAHQRQHGQLADGHVGRQRGVLDERARGAEDAFGRVELLGLRLQLGAFLALEVVGGVLRQARDALGAGRGAQQGAGSRFQRFDDALVDLAAGDDVRGLRQAAGDAGRHRADFGQRVGADLSPRPVVRVAGGGRRRSGR